MGKNREERPTSILCGIRANASRRRTIGEEENPILCCVLKIRVRSFVGAGGADLIVCSVTGS